jgi:hypothetical protein
MHDQIALQTGDLSVASEVDNGAGSALDPRWRELLADELEYRSSNEQLAANA